MKYTLKQKKPIKNQIIVFKAKKERLPEIGIWGAFENKLYEIYMPAYEDVEAIENIEWWMPIE